MHRDVAPAVASASFGVVVAQLNFGDFLPTSGQPEISLVGLDGALVGGPLAFPATRSGDLSTGGVALAALDDHLIVHWTDGREDGSFGRTFALLLGCE